MDTVDVIVATVNAGEYQLLYVDGELTWKREEITPGDVGDRVDKPIATMRDKYRIGDVSRVDPPETYEELCEVTDN